MPESAGPWWQDVRWREGEELRVAPRPLAWESEWMVASFNRTGDTRGGADAGFMMMSIWDVSVGHPGKVFYLEIGIEVRWKRSCPRMPGREPGSRCVSVDVRFMDSWLVQEPIGTGSLSWLDCSIGNLCCSLYFSKSWIERGAMSDLSCADVEGSYHVVLEDNGPFLCQISRRLLHGVYFCSLWFGNLKYLLFFFFSVCFQCCLYLFWNVIHFFFFSKKPPQIHALFSWENTSNKTVAGFFHVGVDTDGCNETTLISHLLSDSMSSFKCAGSLFCGVFFDSKSYLDS